MNAIIDNRASGSTCPMLHSPPAPGGSLPLYQCHKQVRAMKVWRIVATDTGGILLIPMDEKLAPVEVDRAYVEKHNPWSGGYFVVYEDGYQSFSPAKAFEEGYTELKPSTFKERVIAEEAELSERLNKLGEFIRGDVYPTLPAEDRHNLLDQDDCMSCYLEVLRRRIARFGA